MPGYRQTMERGPRQALCLEKGIGLNHIIWCPGCVSHAYSAWVISEDVEQTCKSAYHNTAPAACELNWECQFVHVDTE